MPGILPELVGEFVGRAIEAFFVRTGALTLLVITLGRVRIDETSGFQRFGSGLLGFLLVGGLLASISHLATDQPLIKMEAKL